MNIPTLCKLSSFYQYNNNLKCIKNYFCLQNMYSNVQMSVQNR